VLAPLLVLAEGAGVDVDVLGAAGTLWVAFGAGAGAVEPEGAGVLCASAPVVPSNRAANSNGISLMILIMSAFSKH
jgi:hypothetical protein